MIGKVISTKMQKTVVVEVERISIHPLYKKRVRKTKKFKAHNNLGVEVGNIVRIENTRPISKDKHFQVVEIVKK